MTIEEKAKAYDNVVNKLRRFMAQGVEPLITRADVQDFFSELKEPEDEKIRKEIIAFLKENLETGSAEETWSLSGLERWIAWLEKQGNTTKEVTFTQEVETGNGNIKALVTQKSPAESLGISQEKYEEIVNECIYGEEKSTDNVEPKFKVKYAGSEYNVFETKDIAGVTFYGIEDEPNHIDYVKAENCEIISVYAIKENGSPYPTKPAVFSEKKPKRMISAEAKECIYGSDNEQVSSEKIGKNDTLLDLLHKLPSCITVDGVDYYFVMKKTSFYLAYYACYNGNGEEGRGNAIFGITAHSPIDLLAEMLEILKEKGLLE